MDYKITPISEFLNDSNKKVNYYTFFYQEPEHAYLLGGVYDENEDLNTIDNLETNQSGDYYLQHASIYSDALMIIPMGINTNGTPYNLYDVTSTDLISYIENGGMVFIYWIDLSTSYITNVLPIMKGYGNYETDNGALLIDTQNNLFLNSNGTIYESSS